jgi:hypothetical protein
MLSKGRKLGESEQRYRSRNSRKSLNNSKPEIDTGHHKAYSTYGHYVLSMTARNRRQRSLNLSCYSRIAYLAVALPILKMDDRHFRRYTNNNYTDYTDSEYPYRIGSDRNRPLDRKR